MAIQIQLRRGTASQWTSGNPILATGELGIETDTQKIKAGDGTTSWTSLGYVAPNLDVNDLANVTITDATSGDVLSWNGTAWVNADLTTSITAAIVDSAPGTLNTLNELAAALGDDADFATTVTNSLAGKQAIVSGVSDTEIGYLDGVTSAIQGQIDGKSASSHTHLTADITDLTATAAELNVLDGITSTVTELNYTDGVTSSIQTQLDAKVAETNGAVTTADTGSSVVRNITLSTAQPTGGSDGEVWLVYTA